MLVRQYAALNRRHLDPWQSCTVIDGKNPDKIKTFSYYAECPYEGHCQPGTGFLIAGSGGEPHTDVVSSAMIIHSSVSRPPALLAFSMIP